MKSLGIFSRNLREDFFLKIGVLSAKVYTKMVPNIEVCNFIPAQWRHYYITAFKNEKPLKSKTVKNCLELF